MARLGPGLEPVFLVSTKLPTLAPSPMSEPGRRRANGPISARSATVGPLEVAEAVDHAPPAPIRTPGPNTT